MAKEKPESKSKIRKPIRTLAIADVVQELMDRPLGGVQGPVAHRRQVEAQKIFAQRVFEEILLQLAAGNDVKIKNFGRFSCRQLTASARNPQTNCLVPVKNPLRLRFSSSVKTEGPLNKQEE